MQGRRSEGETAAQSRLLGWLGVPLTAAPLLPLPVFRHLTVCCTLHEEREHKPEPLPLPRQFTHLRTRELLICILWPRYIFAHLQVLLLLSGLFHCLTLRCKQRRRVLPFIGGRYLEWTTHQRMRIYCRAMRNISKTNRNTNTHSLRPPLAG